jgi:hypothetical protein
MFDNPIDNDLLKIDARIREYYGLAPLGLRNVKEEKKTEKAEVSKVDKIPGGEKK